MRAAATPFPAAPDGAVLFTSPWELRTAAGRAPLADSVQGWDFGAVLRLAAVATVDAPAVRETCHLGPSTQLVLVVHAESSATSLRGPVAAVPVGPHPLQLELELVGHELGGRLLLDTSLVATAVEAIDPLSPGMEGAILWRDRKRVWLEGEASRFPTEVADLGAPPFLTPGALWFLDIRPEDLDSAALGAVRLVLNGRHPTVGRILAGDTSPETAAAMSTMRWDVTRQLIFAALDSDEFVARDGAFPDETLGSMLHHVLAVHWPGESARALRQRRDVEPSRFEAELQDRAGLLGG